MNEQRYQAILAVIRDGRTVTEAASDWRVSRQTVHTWHPLILRMAGVTRDAARR